MGTSRSAQNIDQAWMPYYFSLANLKGKSQELFSEAILHHICGRYDDAESKFSALRNFQHENPFVTLALSSLYRTMGLARKWFEVLETCKPSEIGRVDSMDVTIWDLIDIERLLASLETHGKGRPAFDKTVILMKKLAGKGLDDYDPIEVRMLKHLGSEDDDSCLHHADETFPPFSYNVYNNATLSSIDAEAGVIGRIRLVRQHLVTFPA